MSTCIWYRVFGLKLEPCLTTTAEASVVSNVLAEFATGGYVLYRYGLLDTNNLELCCT